MRSTPLHPLFALALLPCSLPAQSTVRAINDGWQTAFGSAAEMTLLANGDVLVQDGHSVMRMQADGTVAWMRNYRHGENAVPIGDIGEQPDGDLIMRVAVFTSATTYDGGWMRTNSQGVPQEARVMANASAVGPANFLAVHSDGSWTMYYNDIGLGETLVRMDANGNILWTKQVDPDAGPLTAMDIEAWGTDLYVASFTSVRKFDASGNEPWAPVYNQGTYFHTVRPTAEGVYFAGENADGPTFGLYDHNGVFQWARSLTSTDPLLLDDPNPLHVDLVHGPAGDLLYLDLSGEDVSFLFHIGPAPAHEALGGTRITMSHAPDRLAPTAAGGAALTYSSPPSSISLVHTLAPTLEPIGCTEAVAFTTSPVTPNALNWFPTEYLSPTLPWEARSILTETVTGTTTTTCTGVGLPELEATRPHVYPQPATDRVQIADLPAGPIQYTVFDATGRAVQQGTGSGPLLSLSLGELEPGVAVVQVRTTHGAWKFPVLMN